MGCFNFFRCGKKSHQEKVDLLKKIWETNQDDLKHIQIASSRKGYVCITRGGNYRKYLIGQLNDIFPKQFSTISFDYKNIYFSEKIGKELLKILDEVKAAPVIQLQR